MNENWQCIACGNEVEVEVAPCDELQAHVESKKDDVVFVGVQCQQRQEAGKHLHKAEVDQQNDGKVLQLFMIAKRQEEGECELSGSFQFSVMINVTNAREDGERADEQCDELELDDVAGPQEDEVESCVLFVLLLEEHVVVDEKEERRAGEEEQVKC